VYLAPLMGTGPFWWRWQEQAVVPCTQNNGALYLFTFTSNVLPRDGSTAGFGCGGWFWYLANDFQFHAVLPLLLLVWAVNSDAGCLVLGALVVSFVGATYHIVDSNNVSALTDIGGANEAIGLGGDYDWHFYTQPVTRAPAFLVGVGLAFALLRVEDAGGARIDGEADADKALPAGAAAVAVALAGDVARALLPTRPDARGGPRVVCWVSTAALAACLALLGWLFYIPTLHYVGAAATPLGPLWSRATVVAWTVLARPAWAAALAGVVFLAALGRAGAVGALLSAPAWAPWSRLAFALYVIHPVVLGVTGLALRQLVDYSPQWIASSFAHTLALSAAAAAALYLVVELPCAAAQRLLLEPAVASALRAAARAGAVAGRCLNFGERAATDDGDDGDPAVDDRKAALLGVQ
jgi:peptidoglycan/LPS O-acetylase OafA/YrhL